MGWWQEVRETYRYQKELKAHQAYCKEHQARLDELHKVNGAHDTQVRLTKVIYAQEHAEDFKPAPTPPEKTSGFGSWAFKAFNGSTALSSKEQEQYDDMQYNLRNQPADIHMREIEHRMAAEFVANAVEYAKTDAAATTKAAGIVPTASAAEIEQYGSASKHQTVLTTEARKIVANSNGFLYAKEEEGSLTAELRPTIPETVTINGNELQLREGYCRFIKGVVRASIDENGKVKKDSESIMAQFSSVSSSHCADSALNPGREQEYRALVETYLKPTMSDEPGATVDQQVTQIVRCLNDVRDRENLSVFVNREIGLQWEDTLQTMTGAQKFPREMYMQDVTHNLYAQYGKGDQDKYREVLNQNAQVVSTLYDQIDQATSDLVKLRDLDIHAQEVPLFNACSSNSKFINGISHALNPVQNPPNCRYETSSFVEKNIEKSFALLEGLPEEPYVEGKYELNFSKVASSTPPLAYRKNETFDEKQYEQNFERIAALPIPKTQLIENPFEKDEALGNFDRCFALLAQQPTKSDEESRKLSSELEDLNKRVKQNEPEAKSELRQLVSEQATRQKSMERWKNRVKEGDKEALNDLRTSYETQINKESLAEWRVQVENGDVKARADFKDFFQAEVKKNKAQGLASLKTKVLAGDKSALKELNDTVLNHTKYQYHEHGIVSDDPTRRVSIETFAAETSQAMVAPLTYDSAVGIYNAGYKGFDSYYNCDNPLPDDSTDLAIRHNKSLKKLLSDVGGLQNGDNKKEVEKLREMNRWINRYEPEEVGNMISNQMGLLAKDMATDEKTRQVAVTAAKEALHLPEGSLGELDKLAPVIMKTTGAKAEDLAAENMRRYAILASYAELSARKTAHTLSPRDESALKAAAKEIGVYMKPAMDTLRGADISQVDMKNPDWVRDHDMAAFGVAHRTAGVLATIGNQEGHTFLRGELLDTNQPTQTFRDLQDKAHIMDSAQYVARAQLNRIASKAENCTGIGVLMAFPGEGLMSYGADKAPEVNLMQFEREIAQKAVAAEVEFGKATTPSEMKAVLDTKNPEVISMDNLLESKQPQQRRDEVAQRPPENTNTKTQTQPRTSMKGM